ncbi:imidazolonepropionase [Halanaerobium praevalens]|uniref:Imidazolonepropionase n=1 Tax=Halanaerobium praevalens (strain ATCC 33744 / DSM 2228 / GSL) TaxID=572479 RepID=E3DLZ0_HALPG|nr:imidazolonepropionase [Halanaerobium praevalens]ADO76249.1 imidazolonepropionase [Halanaerobium praevalens DSM 2228]
MTKLLIKNAKELVTCKGKAPKIKKEMNDLGIITEASLVIEDGIITKIAKSEELLPKINEKEYEIIDAAGKSVLPGFVDSHTHLVFGGERAEEFNWRLKGVPYAEIMERGGGIVKTVEATRQATRKKLKEDSLKRLNSMLSFGVTTVEAKSGYGLDLETELKQLQIADELNDEHPVDIVSTFMGAHEIPKEFKGKNEEFIDYLIEELMPVVVEKTEAEFCDVFCDQGVFSTTEARRLLLAGQKMGLKSKIHADEIAQVGGAELAAEIRAVSADHLLKASNKGIKEMAAQQVVGTLLPITAFSLKEEYARGRFMLDNGLAVALATDFNPGSCYSESIPLLFSLATLYMELTIEEAVSALTINGAAALGKSQEVGSLEVGKKGDLLILDAPSYEHLSYHIGVNIVDKVIKAGKLVKVNN